MPMDAGAPLVGCRGVRGFGPRDPTEAESDVTPTATGAKSGSGN